MTGFLCRFVCREALRKKGDLHFMLTWRYYHVCLHSGRVSGKSPRLAANELLSPVAPPQQGKKRKKKTVAATIKKNDHHQVFNNGLVIMIMKMIYK